MVVKMLSYSAVDSPVAPLNGSSSASIDLPILSVPCTPSTSKATGTLSTASTSPTSCARSATGPPSLPVQTSRSAWCCSSVAPSSMYTTTRQFPSRMFPGMWVRIVSVRPDTSVPLTVPLSKCQESTPSQVPPSGSSPTQHGQRILQVHTSSSFPSSSYAISASFSG